MAIYHLSMKTISRSAGRSTTAAAAYRAGVKIVDRVTGEVHDYTRKAGVLGAAVVLPTGGTMPRAELWNRVEEHHRRKDAVLAREIVIALPAELNGEDRERLALKYARELADKYGVAVDVALHAPSKDGSDKNWHAHIMLTACHVSPQGELGKKCVALDPIHCKKHKLETAADEQRERWAELANAALAKSGQEARIDHRSHAERGLAELPSYHLGPDVTAIMRRGGRSTVVEREQAKRSQAHADAVQELDTARAELEAAEQEVQILERAEAASKARREREAAIAAEVLEEARKRAEAQQKPVAEPTQRELWEQLSRPELQEEISRREAKLAKGIDYYVDNAKGVREVHQKLYELREKTKQAKDFKADAMRKQGRWRDAHPYKSKLHDSGLLKNAELSEWEELEARADAALERLDTSYRAGKKEYEQARSVARINVTQGANEVKAELSELREILSSRQTAEEKAKRQRQQEIARSNAAEVEQMLQKYTRGTDKSKGSDHGLGF